MTAEPLEDRADPREALAAQAAAELDGADASTVIRWAVDAFGDRVAVTTSLQHAVLVDVASRVRPGIEVIFLDTGFHFAETIGMRDAVAAAYPVRLRTVVPEQTVAEQAATRGDGLYARDPDLCCRLRKVEPLERALHGYDAWITGIRRAESPTRRRARVVEWDARRGKVKVNPLVAWTDGQLEDYIAEHGVLVNPLRLAGYPSIGCAPCTRAVAPGDDARSGRWAGTGKTECGLHAS